MRFRSLIFPLVLALILGGLTSWLGRITEINEEEVPLNPNEPQYVIVNAQAKRFDTTGSLQEQLLSPRAWVLPDQKNVYFDAPKLQVLTQGNLQYQVVGKTARYEIASKKVFFDQSVQLNKMADAQRPATQVNTQNLVVDTQTQIAQTDAPVHYQYGQSTGSSQGMTYNHQQGKLDLPAKVKALIYANQP